MNVDSIVVSSDLSFNLTTKITKWLTMFQDDTGNHAH